MITFDKLGKFGRYRFWLNQLPFVLALPYKTLNGLYPSLSRVNNLSVPFEACCEIALLPRDANYYGLLGMKYTPTPSGKELVEYCIGYLDQGEEILDNNLALKTDKVYKGITIEFAKAIAELMETFNGASYIPAGRYEFCTSAYGIVGSSKAIFRRLTLALLEIANDDSLLLDEKKVKESVMKRVME